MDLGVRTMVMQNRQDGSGSPSWWDDLPPGVKRRITKPETTSPAPPEPEHTPYRPAVVADLSRLAILFFAVAVVNILFLLIALSFLFGRGPFAQ
jgi:hypothetical protein